MTDAQLPLDEIYKVSIPVLKDSFVAYLDELGTKAKLGSYAQEDLRQDLKRYEQFMEFLSDENDPARAGTFVINTFSDNISICRPMHLPADRGEPLTARLFDLLEGIALYQFNTAIAGTPLRGGVTIGSAYARPGFVTGSAHLEAVAMEENLAVFPRVLVSEAVVEKLLNAPTEEERELVDGLIRKDDDDKYFLNYLPLGIDSMQLSSKVTRNDVVTAMRRHREYVVTGLETFRDTPRAQEKYAWAARYHNSVCVGYGGPLADVLIDMDEFEPRAQDVNG